MSTPQTVGGRGIVLLGCLSGYASTHCTPVNTISLDLISLYLVEGVQWNLSQIFIMWVGIPDKVFKVKGQGTNVWMF